MDQNRQREELLRRRLAAPFGGKAGSEHPDPELIAAHACNELSPEYGMAITRHLMVCDDGRCTAILRDAIAGAAVARDALYGRVAAGPSEAPPPGEEAATAPVEDPPTQAVTAGLNAFPLATAREPATGERSFECEDALWELFEAAARESGRTVDELLDEAMTAFTRDHREQATTPPPPPAAFAASPSPTFGVPREVTLREARHDPLRERNTPTLQRSYLPRAPASARRASPHPPPVSYAEHLSVIVEGVRYEVTKERFVVGRGGVASDLAIDDPGVSRQHAVIERAGGTYYLVDMGSTNGVEYQGERIARKQIAHGDRFRIGDHELEFLFT